MYFCDAFSFQIRPLTPNSSKQKIVIVLGVTLYMTCTAYGAMKAAALLHSQLLHRILYVPMDFFDTTPKGRILSRFSLDIDCIDNRLSVYLRQTLTIFLGVGQLYEYWSGAYFYLFLGILAFHDNFYSVYLFSWSTYNTYTYI